MNWPMLDVQQLSFDYQDKPLLEGFQISLKAGQLLHLHGRNGTGKTTLLKLLAGLLFPRDGEIRYNNQSIYRDLNAYHQELCYVGHKTAISPLLTVAENCFYDLQWNCPSLELEQILFNLQLQGQKNVLASKLSAGQRRRLGLGRLWFSSAKIWLLDEPLITLDKETIENLMNLFKSHLNKGGLIILSSHQSFNYKDLAFVDYHL